jgi:hypothetical protein
VLWLRLRLRLRLRRGTGHGISAVVVQGVGRGEVVDDGLGCAACVAIGFSMGVDVGVDVGVLMVLGAGEGWCCCLGW